MDQEHLPKINGPKLSPFLGDTENIEFIRLFLATGLAKGLGPADLARASAGHPGIGGTRMRGWSYLMMGRCRSYKYLIMSPNIEAKKQKESRGTEGQNT